MLNQDEFRISESEEGWEGHEYDCYKKGSSNAISTHKQALATTPYFDSSGDSMIHQNFMCHV